MTDSWTRRVIKLLEKRQGMGQQNRPSAGMLKLGVENEIDRFLNARLKMMPFQKSIISAVEKCQKQLHTHTLLQK